MMAAGRTDGRAARCTAREPSMSSVNHVGLTVSDLERSIGFYRDVVGMKLESRVRVSGEWFDTLTHNRGADIDVATLSLEGFTLQLVQYLAGGGRALPLGHHRVGNPHLCITVDDVEAKRRAVVATGRFDPTPIVDIMDLGIRSFYTADPDGVPVEFLQPGPAAR
jgi:catechol 2,3-dioxygenase-like lactoylglutathione lyase family enzyme